MKPPFPMVSHGASDGRVRMSDATVRRRAVAFTLAELIITVAIIGILASIVFAATSTLRRKAEMAGCMANMRTLFVALDSYTQDHGHWPQVPISRRGDEKQFWEFWLNVLNDYEDVTLDTWQCPTYRRESTAAREAGERVEKGTYLPAGFDASGPGVPYGFSGRVPWLMEVGDHHGRGMLVIYPDGSIRPFEARSLDQRK